MKQVGEFQAINVTLMFFIGLLISVTASTTTSTTTSSYHDFVNPDIQAAIDAETNGTWMCQGVNMSAKVWSARSTIRTDSQWLFTLIPKGKPNEGKTRDVSRFDDPVKKASAMAREGMFASGRIMVLMHYNLDIMSLDQYNQMVFKIVDEADRLGKSNEFRNQTVMFLRRNGNTDLNDYAMNAAKVISLGHWLAWVIRSFRQVVPDLQVYGVGHGLGAHLLGVAARNSEGAFVRITALDPSGPCFEDDGTVTNAPTLRRTDATFVDVIHTNGYCDRNDTRNRWKFGNHLGALTPMGTVDFYPNFGIGYPGYRLHQYFSLLDLEFRGYYDAGDDLKASNDVLYCVAPHWIVWRMWLKSIIEPKDTFATSTVLTEVPRVGQPPIRQSRPSKLRVEMGYNAERYAAQLISNQGSDNNNKGTDNLFFVDCPPELISGWFDFY